MKKILFELDDQVTKEECVALGIEYKYGAGINLRCILTGEYRNPKKGEWYVSGAVPEGHKAPNDSSYVEHIAKLVIPGEELTTEGSIDTLLKQYKNIKQTIFLQAFHQLIKPLADRYDWELDWAMGGVTFTTKSGKQISIDSADAAYNSKKAKKLVKKLDAIVNTLDIGLDRNKDSAWSILAGIKVSGSYHKSHGIVSWENRIRKSDKKIVVDTFHLMCYLVCR